MTNRLHSFGRGFVDLQAAETIIHASYDDVMFLFYGDTHSTSTLCVRFPLGVIVNRSIHIQTHVSPNWLCMFKVATLFSHVPDVTVAVSTRNRHICSLSL